MLILPAKRKETSKTFDGMCDIETRREIYEFPDRCSWVVFWRIIRHLVEASVLVDGADHLVASDAIHPAAHAAEVAALPSLMEDHMRKPCTKKDAPAKQRGIRRKYSQAQES